MNTRYLPHMPGHAEIPHLIARQVVLARNYHALMRKFRALGAMHTADYCRNQRSDAMAVARRLKGAL